MIPNEDPNILWSSLLCLSAMFFPLLQHREMVELIVYDRYAIQGSSGAKTGQHRLMLAFFNMISNKRKPTRTQVENKSKSFQRDPQVKQI